MKDINTSPEKIWDLAEKLDSMDFGYQLSRENESLCPGAYPEEGQEIIWAYDCHDDTEP